MHSHGFCTMKANYFLSHWRGHRSLGLRALRTWGRTNGKCAETITQLVDHKRPQLRSRKRILPPLFIRCHGLKIKHLKRISHPSFGIMCLRRASCPARKGNPVRRCESCKGLAMGQSPLEWRSQRTPSWTRCCDALDLTVASLG